MYAQATINKVVKTCIKPGKRAVQTLDAFMKLYAPIFAALHEW